MNRLARLAIVLLVTGCAGTGGAPAESGANVAAVEVWLTTGDRTRLLAREPDLRFGADQPTVDATIVVDPSVAYQEMVGFGAAITEAAAWVIRSTLDSAQRDALLRELFGREGEGLGFSFTRLTIGASDFSRTHHSFDDVPPGATDVALAHFSIDADRDGVLPTVQQALGINPQLSVMASPWSAPAWMKTSGSLIKGTLRDDAYDAFAEYLRRYIEAYGAEGVPIWAITVMNEPHHEPDDYPGMRLEPAQRVRLLKHHLGPLFARHRIETRILEWDHNWDEYASPLAVLADAGARQYVEGVAWHCYAGDVSAQSLVHERYPSIDTFFTECSGGGWAPDFADNLVWNVRTLIIGATRHWARGVLLWNLALDENGGPHLGGCANCRGVVTIDSRTGAVTRNEEYYALGHASRFVIPGARRIESSTGVAGLESAAFRNPDGSRVLIVVNGGGEARTFAVREGTDGFRHVLPAAGVVTFRWRR